MPVRTHDRAEMALTQLESALRLYREGQDYYSVVTLAGAADEVLGQLLKAQGKVNSLDSWVQAVRAINDHLGGPPIDPASIAARANLARNALKHWSPDQPRMISFDLEEEAADMLNRAIDNYWQYAHSLSDSMARFQREHLGKA